MNPKYYPVLRKSAEMAALALPHIRVQVAAVRKADDLIVPVYQTLDNLGIEVTKDQAHEAAILLLNGTYIEVNNYYNSPPS